MRLLFALAPVLSLCLQQTASPKSSTSAAPASAGTAAVSSAPPTKTFRSDAMHLSYRYPASLQSADSLTAMLLDQQKSQATGDMKKKLDCMTIPFAGMDASGGAPQIVMMFRADSGCLHLELTDSSLADFTKSMSSGAAQTVPGAKFSEPQPYKLGERAAAVVHGAIPIPNGGTLHLATACTVNKPDVLCWQMIAPSEEQLAVMGTNTVTFEGAAATSVIPANLLSKP